LVGQYRLGRWIPTECRARLGSGSRLLASLDTGDGQLEGLSVSADGRTVLYTHGTGSEDLMMIENSR
jgi:hypothetical protein